MIILQSFKILLVGWNCSQIASCQNKTECSQCYSENHVVACQYWLGILFILHVEQGQSFATFLALVFTDTVCLIIWPDVATTFTQSLFVQFKVLVRPVVMSRKLCQDWLIGLSNHIHLILSMLSSVSQRTRTINSVNSQRLICRLGSWCLWRWLSVEWDCLLWSSTLSNSSGAPCSALENHPLLSLGKTEKKIILKGQWMYFLLSLRQTYPLDEFRHLKLKARLAHAKSVRSWFIPCLSQISSTKAVLQGYHIAGI